MQASSPNLKESTISSMAICINEHKDRAQAECKAGTVWLRKDLPSISPVFKHGQ